MKIVPAIRVNDIDSLEGQKPGAYEYVENTEHDVAGIDFRCPCGCGKLGYLPFSTGNPNEEGPHWKFNGDSNAPTLQPSVLQKTGCKWHGYLSAGEWREC